MHFMIILCKNDHWEEKKIARAKLYWSIDLIWFCLKLCDKTCVKNKCWTKTFINHIQKKSSHLNKMKEGQNEKEREYCDQYRSIDQTKPKWPWLLSINQSFNQFLDSNRIIIKHKQGKHWTICKFSKSNKKNQKINVSFLLKKNICSFWFESKKHLMMI